MGFHLHDIGTTALSWEEFEALVVHVPPTAESAIFRARYPKSWWWSPREDIAAYTLHAVQVANWQRSGGKSKQPTVMSRPVERKTSNRPADVDAVPLTEIRGALAKRRNAIRSRKG